MFCYTAYGQRLVSELAFPELRPASPGEARWSFHVGQGALPGAPDDGVLLGRQPLYADVEARLFRTAGAWRIVVGDTGVYDLTDGCRTITWHEYPGRHLDFARAHLLGRVLATAMHQSGLLVLHGSAVSFPAGVAAFLAPKYSGKSTLALALTLAGSRLVSDDTLPVTLDGVPLVWPSPHSLRLHGDSAERLASRLEGDERPDGKYVMTGLPPERMEERTLPLVAVYILVPAESIRGGVAVARRAMPQPVAAAALVGQGKVSEMLGPGEAHVLLQRASALARQVPVYQLAILRDMARLTEAVATIQEWHRAQAPPA